MHINSQVTSKTLSSDRVKDMWKKIVLLLFMPEYCVILSCYLLKELVLSDAHNGKYYKAQKAVPCYFLSSSFIMEGK